VQKSYNYSVIRAIVIVVSAYQRRRKSEISARTAGSGRITPAMVIGDVARLFLG